MRLSDTGTLAPTEASPWPDVRVACVWLPQLTLRVEVLRHPAWDGRPLVLGSAPGERKIVQLCSPEAEQMGIRPGLPLREVLPLCREAIVVQPDPVRTAAILDQVVTALQQVTPHVEADDEYIYLDLRGLKALYGELRSVEVAARRAVPSLLRPRIGFAGGNFTAAVAAQASPISGSRVVTNKEAKRFLNPLPVTFLPLDPDIQQQLEWLGLRTIGQLGNLPFAAVQSEFGPSGAHAWRLATGKDDEPIVPRRYAPSVQASLRFDDPLASVDALLAYLDQLLVMTFSDPALAGRSVRQLRLRALLSDSTSWERLHTSREAMTTRDGARRLLRAKLELPNGMPPAPVEELFLELLGLGGEAARQGSLFVARARQMAQIAEVGRHLAARYGGTPLYQAVEVEPWSRIPERRWALVRFDL